VRVAFALLVLAASPRAYGDDQNGADSDSAASANAGASATESEAADAETPPPAMTSSLWHGSTPTQLHWHLLYLPETVLEVVFTPVSMTVGLVEKYRLDKRMSDLLRSDDGRIKVSPKLKLSFGDGLGLGAELSLKELFERRARFDAGGIVRLDGDTELGADYEYRFPSLEGRTVYLAVFHERDGNQPYFGIGGASDTADRRVLRSRDAGMTLGVDVNELGSLPFAGLAEVGAQWQELAPGVDGSRIPVGEMGDPVSPPPAFGDLVYYGSAGLTGSYDTRDVGGKPTRGFYAALSSHFLKAVDGSSLSALSLGADLEWYVPLLPQYRVLVISAGGSSALDPIPGDDIPLVAYPFLGRRRHLRGYDRVRFRDKNAVWTGAEYRYPIYEYLATTAGLDAVWFADLGTVFGEDPLEVGRTRYSFGGGIRGAHETKLIFDMMIGWSPEGVELNLSAGRSL